MFVLFLNWDLKYTGLVMNFGPVPFVPWGTSRRFGRSKNTQREGFYCPGLSVGSGRNRDNNPTGVSASVHAGIPHPPGADTPLEQTPPEQTSPQEQIPPWEQTPPIDQTHNLGADTPQSSQPPPLPRADTPQEQTPPRADTPPGSRHPPDQTPPPGSRHPPPREADSSIRSTSGRYASYWNAFLFCTTFLSYLYMIQNKVIELFSFR